jgi:hypothetical protein
MSDDEVDDFRRQIEQHLLWVDDGFRFTDTSGKTWTGRSSWILADRFDRKGGPRCSNAGDRRCECGR